MNNWTETIEQIRAHARDGHGLKSVLKVKDSQLMPGVHLSIDDPALGDQPICEDNTNDYTTAESTQPADCVVCWALAREAHGVDNRDFPGLPLGVDVWKLKTFDHSRQVWRSRHIGGDEKLAQMLLDLFKWRAEGQQVRLEWSELN